MYSKWLPKACLLWATPPNLVLWFFMKLYFKELCVLGYLLGVLGYSDLLGLGVLGYSDLFGLGVPDEWLLDLPVERLGPHDLLHRSGCQL